MGACDSETALTAHAAARSAAHSAAPNAPQNNAPHSAAFFLRFVNPKELAQTALEQTALELPAQTTDCLSGGARETSFASFCLNYLRFLGVFETDLFASEFKK